MYGLNDLSPVPVSFAELCVFVVGQRLEFSPLFTAAEGVIVIHTRCFLHKYKGLYPPNNNYISSDFTQRKSQPVVSVERFLEKVSALYYFEYAMLYSSREDQIVMLQLSFKVVSVCLFSEIGTTQNKIPFLGNSLIKLSIK